MQIKLKMENLFLSPKEITIIIKKGSCVLFLLLSLTSCQSSKNKKSIFCHTSFLNCVQLSKVTVNKNRLVKRQLTPNSFYIQFSDEINFSKPNQYFSQHKLSFSEKRKATQDVAKAIIDKGLSEFIRLDPFKLHDDIFAIKVFSINNSVVIYTDKKKNAKLIKNKKINFITPRVFSNLSKTQLNIALIDSGVSQYHQQMSSMKVNQYNPRTDDYSLIDTALGHGSGILYLTHQSLIKQNENLSEPQYFSCNGLPQGQYSFIDILGCFEWAFLQPSMDVMISAWLTSTPGCHNEWIYPLQVIWQAQTIPVFSAGNKALEKSMDFSPINLSPLTNVPLISVGALTEKDTRVKTSSFGKSQCNKQLDNIASIMAHGQNIKVAVPLTKTSYQTVEGTSYAVAYVASALAYLKHQFPHVKNEKLVTTLLNSSRDLGKEGKDSEFGYGKLDLTATIKVLKELD